MTKDVEILKTRLQNHNLVHPDFVTAHEVISYYGGLQAQDYPAAKWAIALRMKNGTDKLVETEFNEGKILRTHMMRPTWHFVTPEDIRGIQMLTAHRVHSMNAYMKRKGDIDEQILNKGITIFTKVLKNNNYLTRQELASELSQQGISASGPNLAYVVMHAELEGIICSGPRKGKQFSYALLDERVPPQKKINRDEALAKLTLQYFTSHGPAQQKDFSWWSGLTSKDALEGIDMVKSKLESLVVDTKTYWFVPQTVSKKIPKPFALLLSIFDEYTIAYKDRSDIGDERYVEKLLGMGAALTAVITIDGKIAGTWKRILKKGSVTIALSSFRKFTEAEQKAVEKEAQRYGRFVDLPVSIDTN